MLVHVDLKGQGQHAMTCRQGVSECEVLCGDDFRADVASVLGTDSVSLLHWGKTGKQVTAFVPEGIGSEDDVDQRLQVGSEQPNQPLCVALTSLAS